MGCGCGNTSGCGCCPPSADSVTTQILAEVTNIFALLNAGGGSNTAVVAQKASDVLPVILFSSNIAAKGRIITNVSTQDVAVKFGTGATTSDYTYVVGAGEQWTIPTPLYNGVITGAWVGIDGYAEVTEW